jgi:hypothetical protein
MEIPSDLYDEIIQYFPVRELLDIRLISYHFHESVKSYNRIIMKHRAGYQSRWGRSFPKAIYVLHNETSVDEAYFKYYIKLEKLCLNTCKPIVDENAFQQLPDLRHLEIWSNHWERSITVHITIPMFKHLSNLTSLKLFSNYNITDEAFVYLSNLKHLVLDHCKQITSVGIRHLKNLKTLHIHTQPLITDTAFEPGCKIHSLYIHTNQAITDRGILVLSKLKLLNTVKTKYISGKGFKSLVHLDMLYLNGVTLFDYSDFKYVHHLTLNHCTLSHQNFEEWSSLQYLQIYNTTIHHPSAIYKIASLPQLESFILERCPDMMTHETSLKKHFKAKLNCKNLGQMYPFD